MQRFAIFAILGPALAAVTLLLVLLPLAGLLEGQRIEISTPARQLPSIFLICMFPALVVGLFDWVAEIIEVPFRPIGAAIAGWVLAVIVLRATLALPDVAGWSIAIGLIGGIPAFICSWLTLKINKRQSANA